MIKGSSHKIETIEKIKQSCIKAQRLNPFKHKEETKKKISETMIKRGTKVGANNSAWKGGRYYDNDGYIRVLVRNHPNANCDGRIREHRLVMSNYLGRPLKKGEEVHHRNGVKDDNRIENLELVIQKMHFGKVRCPFCNAKFKVK